MNKISVCTVSMNRLHHIRETLLVNIRENLGFRNIEFVLLDYNSADDLDNWVRANMLDYIESGVLKYYQTKEPVYFNISHSKNMASNLSTGDILCMIDADNYAGPNFVSWIDSVFSRNGNNSLVRASETDARTHGDLGGKLSFHKQLFATVRGFDEALQEYGMDDVDLVNRMVKAGGVEFFIEDRDYMKFISHSIENRLKNYQLVNRLENMYIQIQANDIMKKKVIILYLMKDYIYYQVTYHFNESIRKDVTSRMQGWYTEKEGYKEGKSKPLDKGLLLSDTESEMYLEESDQLLISGNGEKKSVWKKIDRDTSFYMQLVLAYSVCSNFIKYKENDKLQKPVNLTGWGKGTVYLNFDYNNPIYL